MSVAVATFAVFAFMATWNSFLWPLVITQASDRHVTLPVGSDREADVFQFHVIVDPVAAAFAPEA